MAGKREWEQYSRRAVPSSIQQAWIRRQWPSILKTFQERVENGDVRLNRMMENGREPEIIRLLDVQLKFLENGVPEKGVLSSGIVIKTKLELIGQTDDENALVYEANDAEQWFCIHVAFFLEEEGIPMEYMREEVYHAKRREGEQLDDNMIPYLSNADMQDAGEKILRQYAPELLEEPRAVSGKLLAERMGLHVRNMRLSKDNSILGMLFLYAGKARVYDEERKRYVEREIGKNTILIDTQAISVTPGATIDGTIIHECVHYEKHAWYQWFQHFVESRADHIACPAQMYGEWPNALIPLWRMEMQARVISLNIQMPEKMVRQKTEEYLWEMREVDHARGPRAHLLDDIIKKLAIDFNVSKQAMKRRLLELGYMDAHGVLNFVNGKYIPIYIARPGACSRYETYTLDIKEALRLYQKDETLRKLLNTGRFLYIDGHFCLDDPKYTKRIDGRASMTSYALGHIDECCLRFETRSEVRDCWVKRDGVLHCDSFRMERCMTIPASDAKKFEEAAMQMRQEADRLAGILRGLPMFFCDTLRAHMERLGITCEELAETLGVSVRKIYDLRSQESPVISIRMCVALCIGLHLEPELSDDLLRKARIVLSGAKEDVFFNLMLKMMYTYDIRECNELLKRAGFNPLTTDKDAEKKIH